MLAKPQAARGLDSDKEVPMTATAVAQPLSEPAPEVLRRAGNPSRSYFARNPDHQTRARYPAAGLAKWARRLGLGSSQAQERTQWLVDRLARPLTPGAAGSTLRQICEECHLESARACDLVCAHVEKTAAHNTAGLMRRHIHQ